MELFVLAGERSLREAIFDHHDQQGASAGGPGIFEDQVQVTPMLDRLFTPLADLQHQGKAATGFDPTQTKKTPSGGK